MEIHAMEQCVLHTPRQYAEQTTVAAARPGGLLGKTRSHVQVLYKAF